MDPFLLIRCQEKEPTMQSLNLNAFGVLFLLRTANGVKADSFKINISQFFFSPTLLTKASEHLKTFICLIMLINYFTKTRNLKECTAFYLPLHYLYICPITPDKYTTPKLKQGFSFGKRTIRSDGTEAKAFFHFVCTCN